MTLVSLKKGSENGFDTARLELSDGSFLSVKACYINDYCRGFHAWEPGRDLSSPEEEALRFAASCYRAEKAGMRLIARAEQRSWGLTVKLERRGFDSACVEAVVSHLAENDFLNDERYSEIWLRNRLSKRTGKPLSPRRLSGMLRNRGINRDIAVSALQKALDCEGEWTLLQRFLAKKAPPETTYSLRTLLRTEGFSPEVLNRYFEE